jgi:magnesium-transporting ATPase (P-type)
LTDKTGTLTKNDMIFKKLNMEFTSFDTENDKDLKILLLENCTQRKESGPMSDVFEKNQLE